MLKTVRSVSNRRGMEELKIGDLIACRMEAGPLTVTVSFLVYLEFIQ